MASNTYTEDEFKKVLKNLFAEKKRVKELQKQLEEKGMHKKFQAKLVGIHKLALNEEYTTLKAAYLEKERECLELAGTLEKVRPAVKKLVLDLQGARAEIEQLREKKPDEKVTDRIQTLEKENSILIREIEEFKNTATLVEGLKKSLEEKQVELELIQKEGSRFEAERTRLVERLAEGLSDVQRQTDIIRDLREEINTLHREEQKESVSLKHKLKVLEEEFERERRAFGLQVQEWEEREKLLSRVKEELSEAQSQLQKSDLALVRKEYEAKLNEHLEELVSSHTAILKEKNKDCEALIAQIAEARAERDQAKGDYALLVEQFQQALEEKEKVLEQSYSKMRELTTRHAEIVEHLEERKQHSLMQEKELTSLQHTLQSMQLQNEEKDAEIRKAQQHLAKKVKESTILRDLAERQKGQIGELQANLAKQKNELERMQNNLTLQQLHEEKLQAFAKERAHAAENVAKEWQEKYLSLQEDWQEKKAQLLELQKMRGEYDQMAATVSSMRSILGKSEEA